MSYEHRSNIRSRKVSTPMKIFGSILACVVLLYFFFPGFIPSLLMPLVRPLWNIERTLRGGQAVSLELQNATIEELQKENKALHEMLNHRISSSSVMAYILKKPPYSAYDSFVIDAGSLQGLRSGSKVYASGNILIGEVVEATDSVSKVKLYSSFGEKYEVSISSGASSTQGIQTTATGRGGGSFEAFLPRDMKILEGTAVTIPILSSKTFGIVRRVIADPAKAFSTVLFSQPINIYEQEWVEVDI